MDIVNRGPRPWCWASSYIVGILNRDPIGIYFCLIALFAVRSGGTFVTMLAFRIPPFLTGPLLNRLYSLYR